MLWSLFSIGIATGRFFSARTLYIMWHPLKSFIKYFWPDQESKVLARKAKLLHTKQDPEALKLYQKALDANDPKYPSYSSIAFAYAMALDHTTAEGVQQALELLGKAFDAEKDSPSKTLFPTLLLNYGFLSIDLARETKATTPLNVIIDKYRSLLERVAGNDQTLYKNAHHIFGDALLVRQDIDARRRDREELGDAINHLSRAVGLSRGHNVSESRSLQSLATAYNHRYESGAEGARDPEDLGKAIDTNMRAAEVLRKLDEKNPDLVLTQHNLARQYFARYLDQGKRKEDLDEAQKIAKEAKGLAEELQDDIRDLEQLLRVIAAHQKRESTTMTMASGNSYT